MSDSELGQFDLTASCVGACLLGSWRSERIQATMGGFQPRQTLIDVAIVLSPKNW